MNNDDIHGLSGAYAVDAVDDIERARFEAHVAGCDTCRNEVASLRVAASELVAGTLTSPPASLRTSVLRDIGAVRPLPPLLTSEQEAEADPVSPPARSVQATPSTWTPGAPQEPVRLARCGSVASRRRGSGHRQPPVAPVVLRHEHRPADRHATGSSGQGRPAHREDSGTARATVVRSASLNKAVITVANLPGAPQGKVYELWLQGNTMVKAGFIAKGTSNTVLLQGHAATANGAGITIEPAGGSTTPTLPPVALITFA